VSPASPYGLQKLAGEMYCRIYQETYNIKNVALRFFNVYGPRQDPSSPYSGVISRFLSRALKGEALTIFGDGTHGRDFVFVDDIVRANVLAMASGHEILSPLNIGTGVETSILNLAKTIVRVTGSSSPIIHESPRVGDIGRSLAANDRAKQELGWRPTVDLTDGLMRTLAAMAAQPPART
jgi:UDP-glucose 4-epimerase